MSEITLQYTLYDDYASVSGCGDEGDTAIIASSYEGKPVTYIEPEVFQSKTITNLYVPNTITKMGSCAFIYANITNVYYTSIEQICNMELEPYSYYPLYKEYCALANPINWAQNLYINNELLTELTIPETITVIKYGVFAGAQQLTKIIIPATVTKIQTAAFVGTSSLTYLEVQGDPDLYRYYGDYDRGPFYNCSGYNTAFTLKYLTLSSSTSKDHISLISTDCRSKQQTIEISTSDIEELNYFLSYNSKIVSISLPAGLKKISSSLYNCNNLLSVILPDGLEQLKSSLYDCNSLATISIPATIKHIADSFSNCPNLSYYTYNNINYLGNSTLPYLVACGMADTTQESYILADTTRILYKTFKGNSQLTAITIPNTVISIEDRTFERCSKLATIIIPNSVITIGYAVFSGCSELASINIGNRVVSIDGYTFNNCYNLRNVYISDLTKWCEITFGINSYGNVEYSNPLYYGGNLYLNEELVTNLVIPNDITNIKARAFQGCGSITNIILPDSIVSIDDYAFYGIASFTTTIVPSSVAYIGTKAFTTGPIYCEVNSQPTEWASDWNSGAKVIWGCTPSITTISITNSDTYNLSIDKKANDNLMYVYLNDTLIKSFYEANTYNIPITCTASSDVIKIISRYNVKWGISSYILGNTVKNINLANIDFSTEDNLVTIEHNVFENCTNLTSIKLPNNLLAISESLFYNCNNLISVSFAYNVSTIANNAFISCTNLATVNYTGDETDWDKMTIASGNDPLLIATRNYIKQAFELLFNKLSDTKTAAVVSYKGIGSYIEIPEYCLIDNVYYRVTTIGSNAFENCNHLKEVYILSPDYNNCKLTNIGYSAFKNCTSLTDIYLKIAQWQMDVKWDFSGATIHDEAFYNAPLNLGGFCPDGCAWHAMAGPKTIDHISGEPWSNDSFIATSAGHAIINRLECNWLYSYADAEITTCILNTTYLNIEERYSSFSSINSLYFTTALQQINEWSPAGTINNIYYEGTETAWNKIGGHEKITQTVHFSETAITAGNLKEQNELFYPYTTTEAVTDLTAKLNSLYSSISAIEDKLDIISEEFTSEDKTIAGNLYKYLYKKASDTVKYKLQAESAIEDEDGNNLIDTYCKIPTDKYSIPDSTATNVAQLRDKLNTIISELKAINILK